MKEDSWSQIESRHRVVHYVLNQHNTNLICLIFNYLLSLVPALVQTSRNNIDIKFPSKGFNPYISVAYDVSSLPFY